MRITVVPCLSDNYAYVLDGFSAPTPGGVDAGGDALVVDPSEDGPVVAALERLGLRLAGVLATHHHPDHVGGVEDLARRYPGLEVVGFAGEDRIPKKTKGVVDGGQFTLAGLSFDVLHVPGHTTGAVTFVGHGAAFTGDTLFRAGCGRLFEGTPEIMFTSLKKLAALPGETKIYCGHEYTQKNLRFAATVEPGRAEIADAQRAADETRGRGVDTMGTSLALELATNPFLRAKDVEELADRRKARDGF